MAKTLRYAIWFGAAILFAYSIRHAKPPPPAPGTVPPVNRAVALLAARAAASGNPIGRRTASGSCTARNGLPDPTCTPGAIFPTAAPAQICTKGYTAAVRSVPTSEKRAVYHAYGFAYPQARGMFEADHLIALELGGSNEIANLWPEAAAPAPGFHEKDLVENYLNEEVCAGNLPLAAAQSLIARDWLSVYRSLNPDEIKLLKEDAAARTNFN